MKPADHAILLAQLDEEVAEEVQTEIGAEPAPDDEGMPQLDPDNFAPQLVWLAITFAVLYLLMSRVALPRIATVIENRRDRVASDLDAAARLKRETDEAIAAYEQELAEARAKAHRIAGETRDKVNAELAEERARFEAELGEQTAQAETRVAEARDAALAEIESVAAEAAGDIVDALTGKRPSSKELAAALKEVKETA